MRAAWLVCALLLAVPARASAEWQLKSFLGVTFGGDTTLVDVEHAAGSTNFAFGFDGMLLGDILGAEADLGLAPGFFQKGGQNLVVSSNVTTFTGNIVAALPRHVSGYSLRPYLVGGFGMMHASSTHVGDVLPLTTTMPALDVGGGVTGFLTRRVGVSWDVRHFQNLGGDQMGFFGPEHLSFWRANMALVIRP